MSAPIDPKLFSGTHGIKVDHDGGVVGVLEPTDVVSTIGGDKLDWDHPDYVAARDAFRRTESVLRSASSSLDGLVCGLEPPRTDVRKRRCAAVQAGRVSPQTVTEAQTTARAALEAPTSPALRCSAHRLLAWGEAITLQHYIVLPWNRLEPGRKALAHLQAAMRENPNDAAAASTYTMALLGIRASAFRSTAEKNLPIQTTPELERVARRLARFNDDLKAQTLLGMALDDLRREDALSAELANLGGGLRERVERLRARSVAVTEEVDDALLEMRDRVAAHRQ